jgi:hypothetical protein
LRAKIDGHENHSSRRPEASSPGTQIVGLVFSRYVVAVEPIASLAPTELVDVLAPTFQRLLVGPLTD